MTFEELSVLVERKESTTLEFKETTGERQDATKTTAAMLGQRGGHVLFGVKDDGTIVGQQVGSQTLEDVSAELRRIEPACFPAIEEVALPNGRSVVAVLVPSGSGPYTYKGKAYFR
ncbi:hypothetical protein BH11ARM2_BH11ARM2_02870 [soil metagenome]